MATKRDEVTDNVLREIDADQIKKGAPPLSALVVMDDDRACAVFWETVNKYKLRREGEDDRAVHARIANECFAWARLQQPGGG